jgi:glucokinase
MKNMKIYLGLDVGGTKSAVIVGDFNGIMIDRLEWPSKTVAGFNRMFNTIVDKINIMIVKHPQIEAIGVSIGGPLDAKNGIILSPPNLPGWDKIPLKKMLEEKFKLPVYIDHDAGACALAEYYWGTGKNTQSLVYLTCGTGFGMGLVINGQIYYGAQGHNCEIGHARLADQGPKAFGKEGCYESLCSGSAIGKIAAWKFPEIWTSPPPPEEISKLAKIGHKEANKVIEINANSVGRACALIADMLYPEIIILGSLALHLGNTWIDKVKKVFNDEVLPDTAKSCKIMPAGLGRKLQDYSAIAPALNHEKL